MELKIDEKWAKKTVLQPSKETLNNFNSKARKIKLDDDGSLQGISNFYMNTINKSTTANKGQ